MRYDQGLGEVLDEFRVPNNVVALFRSMEKDELFRPSWRFGNVRLFYIATLDSFFLFEGHSPDVSLVQFRQDRIALDRATKLLKQYCLHFLWQILW